MHDQFLHRLRKDPRPEFAARLRSHLRHQPMSPPRSGVPSRARTLLSLLLLGGAAFAVTSVLMRGLPRPVIELYQLTIARIGAGHTATSTHRVGTQGFLAGLQWDESSGSERRKASLRGQPTHSAAATSAPLSPRSTGGASSGSTPVGGAPFGLPAEVRVLTSWAAYPHAQQLADWVKWPHISVFVGNSAIWRSWPQVMCGGQPSAPDMTFTFEPVGSVGTRPCPPDPHNGNPVIAIPRGYEAVVVARSPLYGAPDLTRREVFLALARWVPDPARPGTVHENGATMWRQIDAALGPEPIQIMGPPLSSATGRSMIELLMEGGCNTYSWIAALKSTAPDRYARICRTVRTDGVYTEVSNSWASELLAEPNALGILGFTDLAHATGGNLAVSKIDGVTPTPRNIESGAYPASRGIYLYVNRLRTPRNVLFNFVSFEAPDGAIVALSDPQRRAAFAEALY
ncbi:MAG: substrate-binding domain-containing protein [Steroidobacteraceae bacterium]